MSTAMEDPILPESRVSNSQEDILQHLSSFESTPFSASQFSQPSCPILIVSDGEPEEDGDVRAGVTAEGRACFLQQPVMFASPDSEDDGEEEEEHKGVKESKEDREIVDSESYNPAFESDRSQSPSNHRPWDGFGDVYSSGLITQSQNVANMEPVSKTSRNTILSSVFQLVNSSRKSEVPDKCTGNYLEEQDDLDANKVDQVTDNGNHPNRDEKQKNIEPAPGEQHGKGRLPVANSHVESHVFQEVLGNSHAFTHTGQDVKVIPGRRARSTSVSISSFSNFLKVWKRGSSDDVIASASSIENVRQETEQDKDENEWRSVYKKEADVIKNPSTSLPGGRSERETKSQHDLSTKSKELHKLSVERALKDNDMIAEGSIGSEVNNVEFLRTDESSKHVPYSLIDLVVNCSGRLSPPKPHDPDLLSLAILSGVQLPLPLRDCTGKLIREEKG